MVEKKSGRQHREKKVALDKDYHPEDYFSTVLWLYQQCKDYTALQTITTHQKYWETVPRDVRYSMLFCFRSSAQRLFCVQSFIVGALNWLVLFQLTHSFIACWCTHSIIKLTVFHYIKIKLTILCSNRSFSLTKLSLHGLAREVVEVHKLPHGFNGSH